MADLRRVAVRAPFSRVADVEVFAVDATSAQLTFRDRQGPVRIELAGTTRTLDETRDAAVVDFVDLEPATGHVATLSSIVETRTIDVETKPDIGPVHSRFATISDLHLGSEAFGPLKRLKDPGDDEYTLRCARAAVREAQAWGAEILLLKGDVTEYGELDHWKLFEELLDDIEIPLYAIPGNHDTFTKIEIEPDQAFSNAGVETAPVQVIDLPGLRIVLADTSIAGRGTGTLRRPGPEIVDAARATDLPVLVATHHNIQRTPIAWFWPPGISSTNAKAVVDELAAANDNVFITSGHTHRHRRHRIGPNGSILFTEVGSTSDYPGTWAGYEVSDTTIRQTVRRIADPTVVAWTERSRSAVGGIWPMWSQGLLDDRCVDMTLRR